MRPRLITIVDRGISRGRCKFCRAPILWVTTASRPGSPARTLPFDLPRPWPLSTDRNDDTGLAFETWPASALHFATCPRTDQRKANALEARG
jgi:hypothetical protein